MPLYLLIPAFAGMALFGWVAGMWTHKRAEHWCTACGWQLDCGQCRRADADIAAGQTTYDNVDDFMDSLGIDE